MPRNPRKPKHVENLIADAQKRQVDSTVLRWLRGVARIGMSADGSTVNMRRRDRGGTRGGQREDTR